MRDRIQVQAGQDNDYQHVIFMAIPWSDGGYRTMCARAVEPTNEQKAMILALKGITAAASLTMPAGSKVGLMQLVIETNKSFDEMVGDKFPRATRTVQRPMHVTLGEMEVRGGGLLSLEAKDIGTKKIFYDIIKAEEEGHFGPEPIIWKAPEMHFALEMMCSALDLEGKAWEEHVYSPTMWQDEEGKRRLKASKQQKDGLTLLRALKRNPSEAAAHMRKQPAFRAKDVGFETAGREQVRKKQRDEAPPAPPGDKKADAVMKEIMLAKEPRPAVTAKEMAEHREALNNREDFKDTKKVRRTKNAKRAKFEEAKALKEKDKRADEIAFNAALK